MNYKRFINRLLIIILVLLLIYIYYFNNIINNPNHRFRYILMNLNRNIYSVIYLVNPTAGFANTIRGMSSTIFLSYFFPSSFKLKGWNSIVYYFDFPKEWIYYSKDRINIYFSRFNDSIFNIYNKSILITDIYGFTNLLLHKYYKSKQLFRLQNLYNLKSVTSDVLTSIIYNEIFIPSDNIKQYINIFNIKKKGNKVIGIHIRSGKFNNKFNEKYFKNTVNVYNYYKISRKIISIFNISLVFATSDNKNNTIILKTYFKEKMINIPFKGNIVHSRFSLYNEKINENAIRIISEFLILSSCDVILGTKYSSFSYESCKRYIKKCIMI